MNNKVSNKRKMDNNIKKIVRCDAPLPKASLYAFLLVTLLSMLLISFTIGNFNIVSVYFSIENRAPITISSLFLLGLIFFIINFNITRGNFRYVFYLKIYILFLICLSLLSLLTYNPLVEIERSTAIFIQILSGLFALHIMFSKNYIEMVRHQHEGVNFFKNFDERIQIEIEQNKLKK